MFSQLGPLFKTTFRQAESNDTRLAIPHDEREKGRRKQTEEEDQNKNSEAWEDNTTVTVEALRAFLIGFLKTLPGGADAAIVSESEEQLSVRPPESRRPTNTKNAKAVRAYQSMAEKTQSPAPPSPPPLQKGKRVEPTADLLESQELRDIHGLIDDLDTLANHNVQILKIQKADTFIDSLKNAVRLAKSKIKGQKSR